MNRCPVHNKKDIQELSINSSEYQKLIQELFQDILIQLESCTPQEIFEHPNNNFPWIDKSSTKWKHLYMINGIASHMREILNKVNKKWYNILDSVISWGYDTKSSAWFNEYLTDVICKSIQQWIHLKIMSYKNTINTRKKVFKLMNTDDFKTYYHILPNFIYEPSLYITWEKSIPKEWKSDRKCTLINLDPKIRDNFYNRMDKILELLYQKYFIENN